MIAPADVQKLKCRLVTEAAKYFRGIQYFIDTPLEPVKCAYIDMLNGKYVSCVDNDFNCELLKKLKTYKDLPCQTTTTVTCEDQLPITISITNRYNCNYTSKLYNSSGVSPLAEFSIANNSDVVTAAITAKLLSTCGIEGSPMTFTNQISYSDRPKGNTRIMCGGGTWNGALTPDSYVKVFRIFETDSFGVLQPTAIDLDLDPATSIYYGPSVDFPDLVAVSPSDVQMGSFYTVFLEAWENLMDNVSRVRYGAPGLHRIRGWATNNGTYFNLGSAPMHNPAGNFFGVNREDAYVKMWTPSGDKTNRNVSFLTPTSVIGGTATYNLSCGAVNLVASTTSLTTPIDYAQTSFNKIALISNFASQPVTYTANNISCVTVEATASYDHTNVTAVQWTNPSDVVISTTDVAQLPESGTYTFSATVDTGCVSDKTITI